MKSLEEDLSDTYGPVLNGNEVGLYVARQWHQRSQTEEQALLKHPEVQGLVLSSFRHDNPGPLEQRLVSINRQGTVTPFLRKICALYRRRNNDAKTGNRREDVEDRSDCYVIAEIGHNHQGKLETAKEMFRVAKECGADAVKLQKRDNRQLYTTEHV